MTQSIIKRILGAASKNEPALAGAERALPLALGRVSRDHLDMQLDTSSLKRHAYSLPELLEMIPEHALIILLGGPKEAMGALIINHEMMAGLIEMQALGSISPQIPQPRKPTRTDAVMMVDWINHLLHEMQDILTNDPDLPWADGFHYGSYVDETRALGLMLDDTSYRVLQCQCLLNKTREGRLVLALPAEGRGRMPASLSGERICEQNDHAEFGSTLHEQIMRSEVQLNAVLHRISMPLSTIMHLQVGDTLPLPATALDQIELVGLDGRIYKQGKLGQNRGMRALRVYEEDMPAALPASQAQPVAADEPADQDTQTQAATLRLAAAS